MAPYVPGGQFPDVDDGAAEEGEERALEVRDDSGGVRIGGGRTGRDPRQKRQEGHDGRAHQAPVLLKETFQLCNFSDAEHVNNIFTKIQVKLFENKSYRIAHKSHFSFLGGKRFNQITDKPSSRSLITPNF